MKKYIIFFALLGTIFAVDFSNDVSPIIYKNCTGCHRVGEIAAFLPLISYENIYDNRDWIIEVISGEGDGRHDNPIMPPWPPDREYSTMVGERYLTESELHTVLQWIEDGAPQGNPDDEFPMPEWPEGSQIGVPDVVYQMEEPTFIEGNFEDYYRCYVIETGISEDKDIAAIEFRPDNSEAVHHALIIVVPHGLADELDEADPGYGYECYGGFGLPVFPEFVGGYAPGFIPATFPEGLGQELPANSDFIVQMHYAPLNTDQTDQSSFNVFFKDEPVERYVQEHLIIDYTLVLPPEQISTVTNTFTVYEDVSLVSLLPHCHLIGQSWEIYGVTQSNDVIPILKIPQWSFDWQSFYSPQFMQRIPAGTVITATCVYDNTSNNPNNPNDPPQWMGWGEGTNDEMFFVPIRYVPYQEGDENIFLGSDEEAPVLVSQLEGWNLIGLPREVEDPIYSALFPEALTGTLYSYDNSGGYNSEEFFVTGKGYWLRFPSTGQSYIFGDQFDELTISLSLGWNIISGTSQISEILDPNDLIVSGTLYEYDNGYIQATSLMPGKGYWVRTTNDGEITVQTMDGFANVSTPNDELIGNSNKITFTNSKGHSTQLNFGITVPEEEKIFYSLPPTPPAGGFDIRFDDDLRLGDVGSEIFIQNSHWPLKIEIQNNNGMVLRDEGNGKEYSFGENGFVTITEPTERLILSKGTLVPNTFALHQNYPNPFNPVTTISYDLPEASDVELSVFDINGRFVEKLVTGRVVSGKHSAVWDSKDVSSGIYIYRLTTHQKQITRKMVLLK